MPTVGSRTSSPKQKNAGSSQSPASGSKSSKEMIMEAAQTAAYRVAEAENKAFLAAEAVKEFEKFSKLAEETDSILQLTKEIYKQCMQIDNPIPLYYFSCHISIIN